jgi:penicillin-binding protein 2
MDTLANKEYEQRIFLSRYYIAIGFIVLITSVIIARIYNLQVINHQHYLEEALGNQLAKRPIPPFRGKIFDRKGRVLADNKLAYRLTITPEKIKDINQVFVKYKEQGLITDKHIEKYLKVRKNYKKFDQIPIKYNLSEEEMASFLISDNSVGVDIEPYFQRYYPEASSAVHILGYVSKMSQEDKEIFSDENYQGTDYIGKIGIERQYEELLHGSSGTKQIERNVDGRIIDTDIIKPSKPGANLYLSIDLDLQKKAEELLTGKRGAIVVVDVNSGELLTLASSPIYDPNLFVNGISVEDYKSLTDSKDIPQLNRTIQGLYPPGSTIKPMVLLAGLEEDVIKDNHVVFCRGFTKLPNYSRKFNDWKKSGHGKVNTQESIAQSCDVFYYELADEMGIDKIHDNLQNFYFGKPTGIDIPGEKAGVLPSKIWKKINKNEPWYRGETLITGIGQGYTTVSPLQLALATAAIANKGYLYKPRILKNYVSDNKDLISTKTEIINRLPIKDIHHWDDVISGMEKTIYGANGTARRLNTDQKYTFAGKTGTAQVFGLDPEEDYIAEKYEEHLRDHALFNAFAPIKNPEIAIAVIVENAGSGSSKAAPLAKAIFDEYFKNKETN